MIQALAGRFGRNLCYLSPTHPELSDDSLKSAIERVPDNAIVVLEDVDALFGKGREKKVHQSPLTFSGLLNALDGVGNHNGLVFVLTTNFKDQLDAALIRDGRVDLRVRFDYCTPDQMEKLFDNFYPPKDANALEPSSPADAAAEADTDPEIAALEAKLAALKRAKEGAAADGTTAKGVEAKAPNGAAFRDALLLSLGDRKVSAAHMQSFFVSHRKCTAAEAIANVGAIAAAIDKREEEEAAKQADSSGSPAAEAKADEDSAEEGKGGGGGKRPTVCKTNASTEGKAVHVHIHTSGP